MSLHDAIVTSVSMGIFPSRAVAIKAQSTATFVNLPLSKFRNMENFDPARLNPTPYPAHNRPRGEDDIASVNFHRRILKKKQELEPVWIVLHKNRYVLLDGAHRVAAANLEDEKTIPAYIITLT